MTKSPESPPNTAPKDTVIIAIMKGYPWPVQTVYNQVDNEWVVSTIQAGMVDGKDDLYFENECYNFDDLICWWKMPNRKATT